MKHAKLLTSSQPSSPPSSQPSGPESAYELRKEAESILLATHEQTRFRFFFVVRSLRAESSPSSSCTDPVMTLFVNGDSSDFVWWGCQPRLGCWSWVKLLWLFAMEACHSFAEYIRKWSYKLNAVDTNKWPLVIDCSICISIGSWMDMIMILASTATLIVPLVSGYYY